jgi:transposase
VKAAIVAFHAEQHSLPTLARKALHGLIKQMRDVGNEIDKLEKQILSWHRNNAASRRLAGIPGIGPITASAIVAAAPDATQFSAGRSFAAWLGLTPRSHSSGGKEKLVGISKQGIAIFGACLLSVPRRLSVGRGRITPARVGQQSC